MAGSKTARRSTSAGAGGKQGFHASGSVARIVPLAGGTMAYVRSPTSVKNVKARTDSEEFLILIDEIMTIEHLSESFGVELNSLEARYPGKPLGTIRERLAARAEAADADETGEDAA